MLDRKEIAVFLTITIIFAFLMSMTSLSWSSLALSLLFAFIILLVNIIAKKVTAFYFDSCLHLDFWHVQQYGLHKRSHFPKPIPFGLIVPIVLGLLTLGYLKPLTFMQFEAEPTRARASKRHGVYSYSGFAMNEFHLGVIVFFGMLANLLLVLIAKELGASLMARYSLYYVLWNLLPISRLDGSKLFFGSLFLWCFTLFLCMLTAIFLFL